MKQGERKNKSVSFNSTDKFEIELREHAEKQGNFSSYVKRLILIDKLGLQVTPAIPPQQVGISEKTDAKEAAMKSISL